MKVYFGFIFIVGLSCFSCKAQSIKNDVIKYKDCIDWLEYRRPTLVFDTLGAYGVKDVAAEYLLKNGCDFVGELFPVVEYYFGQPERVIDFSKNDHINHIEYSMRYVLYKPPGTSTTGMKWLIVDCDKDYRIVEFSIFTIDE